MNAEPRTSTHACRRDTPLQREALRIERLCLNALEREAAAWPKPGLVTPVDSGSHRDMDYTTFLDSIDALQGYFAAVTLAGAHDAGFAELQRLGRAAETRMLAATRGANTHRGAIFNLGLLAAAAGRRAADAASAQLPCGRIVARQWGRDILASRPAAPPSHGNAVFLRFHAGGARQEAAGGFPAVYRIGLPTLRRLLAQDVDRERALVGTLVALMAALPDTNLLWRGGPPALAHVRSAAHDFNAAGGVTRAQWREPLLKLHRDLVLRNLSPGGSADLVAATWLVHQLDR